MVKSTAWSSWGASMIGPAHIKLNIVNQDTYLSRHFFWGDVLVVADGLGSHMYSHEGSKAICRAVVSVAKIYSNVKHKNIQRFLKRVQSKWLEELGSFSPKEASSTVLFVVRYKKEFIVCQLGDGIIMGFSNDGNSFILNENKDESFSNITHSLKKNIDFENWKVKHLKNMSFKTFVLLTDGVSDDLVMNKELEFGEGLYKNNLRYSKKRVEKSLKYMLMNWPVPNHSDDKTIACLYRER